MSATSRRHRQLEELRDLCRAGMLARAVDLAFEHVTAFGHDPEVLDLLAAALERGDVPAEVRRRFADLCPPSR